MHSFLVKLIVHCKSLIVLCAINRLSKLLTSKISTLQAVLACVASVFVGFGAKKDRGTGFSVLATREMKQEPFFAQSLTLVPRSLLLNRTETLSTQAKAV